VNESVWFDPVRQRLGKKSWIRIGETLIIQMSPMAPIKAKRPAEEDPLTLKIIGDLKPKNKDSEKELC